MVFTKPLDVEDHRLVYFKIIEPPTLRYIYIGRPAKNFGANFVSCIIYHDIYSNDVVEGYLVKYICPKEEIASKV